MLHNDFVPQLCLAVPNPCMCWKVMEQQAHCPEPCCLTPVFTGKKLDTPPPHFTALTVQEYRPVNRTNNPCSRNPTETQKIPECLSMHRVKRLLEIDIGCSSISIPCRNSRRHSTSTRSARIWSVVDLPGVNPDYSGLWCFSRWVQSHVSSKWASSTLPGTLSSVIPLW